MNAHNQHVQPDHIGYAKTNFDDAVDQLVGGAQ
jgi:hypothetical protein